VASFVLLLAATGLALNHTEALRLDQRFVHGALLQDWYGLGVPDEVVSFAAGDRRVSLLGDTLYLDTVLVPGHFSDLAGAIATDGMIYAVADGDVLVLLPDGRLVERLGAVAGIPAGIEAIGLTADARAAVIAGGRTLVARDPSLSAWQVTPETIRRAAESGASAVLLAELRERYRDRMLSFERVLLDLHSGRIFGRAGPLMMDAAAVLFIALALTGIWMWLRRPPHGRPDPSGRAPRESARTGDRTGREGS
jgi:hypothetical protein